VLALDRLGAKGMFIRMIAALLQAEILHTRIIKKRMVIKMPDGVPPAVANSFVAYSAYYYLTTFLLINA